MRGVVLVALLLVLPVPSAAQDCEFTTSQGVMLLSADCTTDVSIEIPDGLTLDGNHHQILAVRPASGSFRGGVVLARGARASIINTTIAAVLSGPCQFGSDRLRGIYFEGAAGAILGNTVRDINLGPSACAEGNAIEARNPRFDGEPVTVRIEGNVVDRYQKSGIFLHGRVDAIVRGNQIGASATQAFLPANAMQIGPGARARIDRNVVSGNAFPGVEAVGTAILLVRTAAGTVVVSNVIVGNADVGIHVDADGVLVEHNELIDTGPDGFYDIAIADLGAGNSFENNTMRGYRTRFFRMDGGSRAPAQLLE